FYRIKNKTIHILTWYLKFFNYFFGGKNVVDLCHQAALAGNLHRFFHFFCTARYGIKNTVHSVLGSKKHFLLPGILLLAFWYKTQRFGIYIAVILNDYLIQLCYKCLHFYNNKIAVK